jgi:lysylphosphatidylglycerol synthase-like protein
MKTKKTLPYLRVLAAVASVALFVWMVSRIRLVTIRDQLHLLGSGFILLILLSGARHLLRAVAWQRCISPEERNLGLLDLFGLRVIGEAIMDMTPGGPLVSEPAKVLAVSLYMPALASASSVLIENLIYGFAALLFILSGVTIAFFEVAALHGFRWIAAGVVLGLVIIPVLFLYTIISRKTPVLGAILDYLKNKELNWTLLKRYDEDLRLLEASLHNFFVERWGILFSVLAIEFATNFTGVAEGFLILKATTTHSSFLAAYLLESASRAVQFACAFVPFGLGVQEGAAALTLRGVGYNASEGVTLAIIRRIRTVFWAGIGLVLAGKLAVMRKVEESGVS